MYLRAGILVTIRADDVLLVARSLKVLSKMVVEMRRAVADVGLEMHLGKTKILANE